MNFKIAAFSAFFLLTVVSQDAGAAAVKSTLADQKAVEVTVYNNNLALVKDTREIKIEEGTGELYFMDVASSINPVTVSVRNLDEASTFEILEQNYEYDLISQEKLLEKYVGKNLKIMQWNEFQDRKEIVDALLVSNNGSPIYKIDNQIYLNYDGVKILPEIPENLIEKPTLAWLYQNKGAGNRKLEVSYLTSDMGWHADYVFVLDAEDAAGDLSGWVTLDNKSGTAYQNASLKLVAGDVNQVQQHQKERMELRMTMADAAAPQFQERSFFEYHIYDLQRPATLKNNQTKQVRFIDAGAIKVAKEYVLESFPHFFYGGYQGGEPKQPVAVRLKIMNKAENNLGMPLPAGVLRIYKKDTDGTIQFAGEDSLQHTPKDEEIELKIGNAFDVTAERVQTDFQQKTQSLYETEWEIHIRNHKDKDIVVNVREGFGGGWKIISNSHSYEKKDAFTAEFQVSVPAGKEETLHYRVSVGLS